MYGGATGILGGTLDRHSISRLPSATPVRSLSTQHFGTRTQSVRRMRQLLELGGALTHGTASPAPTPSSTLSRSNRQVLIIYYLDFYRKMNYAFFS